MNELKQDILNNYSGRNHFGKNANYFAQKYNISISRIYALACDLKVTYSHKLRQQTVDIVNEYKNGASITEIKRKYGHDTGSLKKILIQNGVRLRSQSECNKKYKMDDSYFNKINTPEKAYWLGFIYADGNLYNGGLQIGLADRDKDHLELLLNCLKSNHPIYKDQKGYKLIIRRDELYQNLKKLGLTERKSLVLAPPSLDILPKEFTPSFLLGYFDGDGSISINDTKKTWFVSIISTLEMCQWIRNELRIVGINGDGCLHQELRRGDKNVWYIDYGGGFKTERGQSFIKKLYNYLYHNCPVFLKRKKDKFIECVTFPARKKTVVDKAYRRKVWAKYYAKNKEKLLASRRDKQ